MLTNQMEYKHPTLYPTSGSPLHYAPNVKSGPEDKSVGMDLMTALPVGQLSHTLCFPLEGGGQK